GRRRGVGVERPGVRWPAAHGERGSGAQRSGRRRPGPPLSAARRDVTRLGPVIVSVGAASIALLVAMRTPAALSVVSWRDAPGMVGAQVTVEGDVVEARTTADTCVLEFTIDDPHAFRVVLLIPAITSLPRQPERL